MQKTTYYCDICKKTFAPYDLHSASWNGKIYDFCDKCNEKLTIKIHELITQGDAND